MGTIDLNLPEQIVTDGNLGICLIEIENMVVQTSEGLISEDEAKCLLTEFLDALGIVAASNEVIHLYTKILDLERKNWNRIWCRIIKNHFASASLNDFDVIVGNPPWLRWSSLPETYRNTIKPFCVQYGLFSSDNFVGGIESDISTMVLYTAAQKWLRTGGRLAFLITRTVFKTESSEGFRKFRVPNDQTLQFRVIKVEDFTDLKPFEGATNKPALVVIEKGKKTKYPVKWTVWKRINRNPIGDSYDLKEVKRETDVVKLVAHPLKNEGDPWLTVLPSLLDQCLALVRKDESDYYLARKGICTDCNGIYYGNILSKRGKQQVTFENSPELGRNNKVTKVRANIEKSLIYPIARGREVSAFHWNFSGVYGIVPQSGMDGFPRLTMLRQYPKALNFFNNFNAILPTRASFRRYHLKRNAPIYSCWNVGPYTFSPYKVAWAEISGKFSACVISSFNSEYWDNPRVIIPDHKLYFVPLDNEQEAHYLCAFLNAPQVADFIHGYVENTQIGTHITEYLDIPKFNAKRKTHIQLSEISQNAHQGAIDSEEAVSRIEVIVKRVLKRKSTKS
ncbi:Eco57I restriction-modification methylase domain-containing protein [Syntrophomonas palmitatica]|uniref:Eco57I restriction-modification methylase domain-containing protein n=1 Tax=Syntrophomonas palmitatica TaxID=402877 RepID=UPI000A9C94DA|nr:hypothetical protein [Syntrophomonas palmitatica]